MDTSTRVIGRRSGVGLLQIALALVVFSAGPGWAQTVGIGDGLLGSYFDNRHLSGTPVTSRVEARVDFDWGLGAPVGLTNPDEFSARWTGELQAQSTESYTLYVDTDDGARVWFNEQLIIDNWVDAPTAEATATVNLIAGQKYLLRVEYYENHLYAGVRLKWSSPATPQQIIPQSQLYSVPTDADQNGLADLWELACFGRIGLDPNGDDDGDGLTNLAEYQRWSDPRSALDRGVPNGWRHGSLGSALGDVTYSNGVFTVSSTGRVGPNDLGGNADAFHFVYQPLKGNGQIVARVLGLSGVGGGSPARVDLMFRQSLNDNSPFVSLLVSGGKDLFSGNDLVYQGRQAVGGELEYERMKSLTPNASCETNLPYWIKAVLWSDARSDYHFLVSYRSPDAAK